MTLTQTRVSFPVLEIRSVVHHSTPRKPTAFERVLLQLCVHFGNDATYNNISLERIFIDILGVADPNAVVLPTLHELLNLDAIRCRKDTSTIGHIVIRDLELTERGQEMVDNDILPARPQDDEIVHLYDPVRQRFLSGSEEKTLRDLAGISAIDEMEFVEIYPGELILNDLKNASPNWLQANSRIEWLEKVETSIRWIDGTGNIELTNDGFGLAFQDDAQTKYVNAMPAEQIFNQILRPALLGPWIDQTDQIDLGQLPPFELNSSRQVHSESWTTLASALSSYPEAQKVWFVGMASLVVIPETAPAGHFFLVFNSVKDTGQASVSWNKDRNGAIVQFDSKFPIGNCVVATPQKMLLIHRLRIELGEDEHDIPLAYWSSRSDFRLPLERSLVALSRSLILNGDQEATLAPSLWTKPDEFWQVLLDRLEAEATEPLNDLESLLNWRTKYLELNDMKTIPDWDNHVLRLFRASSVLKGDFDLEQAESVAKLLLKCGIASTPNIVEAIQLLIEHCSPPSGLQGFGRLSAILRDGGERWKAPYPSRIYSPNVVRESVQMFGQPILLQVFTNENDFELATLELQQIEMALATAIGVNSLAIENTYSPQVLLRNAVTAICYDLVDEWERKFAAYQRAYPEVLPYLPDTPLENAHRQITSFGVLLKKLTVWVDSHFNEVVVVDTSVFIDDPSVLNHFRNDQLVVVSKRVIEELDDNKQNESLRPRIANATRALNAFDSKRIHFCDADLTLLPKDYRNKGDNLILSVALKYRRYKPFLLTNDDNLALKAKAENITALRLSDFIQRTRHRFHKEPTNANQAQNPMKEY